MLHIATTFHLSPAPGGRHSLYFNTPRACCRARRLFIAAPPSSRAPCVSSGTATRARAPRRGRRPPRRFHSRSARARARARKLLFPGPRARRRAPCGPSARLACAPRRRVGSQAPPRDAEGRPACRARLIAVQEIMLLPYTRSINHIVTAGQHTQANMRPGI